MSSQDLTGPLHIPLTSCLAGTAGLREVPAFPEVFYLIPDWNETGSGTPEPPDNASTVHRASP